MNLLNLRGTILDAASLRQTLAHTITNLNLPLREFTECLDRITATLNYTAETVNRVAFSAIGLGVTFLGARLMAIPATSSAALNGGALAAFCGGAAITGAGLFFICASIFRWIPIDPSPPPPRVPLPASGNSHSPAADDVISQVGGSEPWVIVSVTEGMDASAAARVPDTSPLNCQGTE